LSISPFASSFETFVRQNYRRMLGSLTRAGWSEPAGEDALQIALLDTWRRWSEVDYPRRYTMKIAMRMLLTDKAKKRPSESVFDEEEHTDLPVAADLAAAMATYTDEAKRVLALLRTLPEKQRIATALKYDGYTPAEIAEEMGIEVPTVRSHLRHARENLEQALGLKRGEGKISRKGERWKTKTTS